MIDRSCETCGSALVRRPHENSQKWSRRRFCSQRCVWNSMTKPPDAVADEQLRGQSPTAREMQVVRLVACGRTNPEIATELDLSPKAVKNHLAQVAAKLGTGDRAGIVGAAIRTGRLQVAVTGDVPPGFDKALFDVLVRIARGRTNPEIASELHLSFDAVKSRVRKLFAVFGVCSREEAVVAGMACGALRLVPVRQRERVAA